MHTILKYNDGSSYVGSVNEKKERHGYGKICWNDDSSFEGKWSYNKPISGTYIGNDGYKYKGQVSYENELVITGNGISYYTNGCVYVGYHREGLCSCKGTYYHPNGNILKGFWVDGVLSTGEFILANGNTHKGYFYHNNSLITFDGVETKWDGSRLKGKFVNFILEGQGTLYYFKNKIEYQGEWKNGLKHGRGILYYRNGDTYEGEWQNNVMHGKGILKCTGYTLNGTWINGCKEGKFICDNIFQNIKTVDIYENDKLIKTVHKTEYDPNRKNETIHYKNNSLYVGEIKDKKPNGIGILYPNGDDKSQYYIGNFKNGKLTGSGICELKDYRYDGHFKKGKIQGQGIMMHKDRSGETIGYWKKGIPHGYCRLYKQITNITIIEGNYNGARFKNNIHIIYEDKREYYGNVCGFIPHGKGRMLYPDNTMIIGKFKKGKPNGQAILLENNKKYDCLFKKGECVKKREWVIEV